MVLQRQILTSPAIAAIAEAILMRSSAEQVPSLHKKKARVKLFGHRWSDSTWLGRQDEGSIYTTARARLGSARLGLVHLHLLYTLSLGLMIRLGAL